MTVIIPTAGSQSVTQFVREIDWGVTPTTPTMFELPIESNTLQVNRTTLTDNTLRPDRMGGDVRPGMSKNAGALKFNYRRGDFDDILCNLFQAEWSTNKLTAGKVPISHSAEVGYTDNNQYFLFKALRADKLTIAVKPNSLISTTIDFIGKPAGVPTIISNATVSTPPTDNEPFDSFTGSMKEGGSDFATVTAIDLSFSNNLTESIVLFQDTISGIVSGNLIVTGTLTAQFFDAVLYNKFYNRTNSSLEFTLLDVSGKSHKWSIPKIIYTSGDISPTGPGELSLSLKFHAQYDSTLGSKISITRTV